MSFIVVFQHSRLDGHNKALSNLNNLLDIYNIRPMKKSVFGYSVDNIQFFYQLKNQEYKYIFNEVGTHIFVIVLV